MPALPLSANLPLRTSADWGQFETPLAIPHCYGAVRTRPLAYDAAGRQFVLSDGPIVGVTEVTRDGVSYDLWRWGVEFDAAGERVSTLTLNDPLQSGEELIVSLQGKQDSVSGELLTNPALVVWDILSQICGMSIERARFDALRAATADSVIAGVVSDNSRSIRSQIAEICDSVGIVWALDLPEFGLLWP